MVIIENIGQLASMNDASSGVDPVVVMDGETIAYCGPRKNLSPCAITHRIDACGKLVIPGLIDCHSHLMFAGARADEFARRMNHERYQDIMAKGGGIMATVLKTRAASDDELLHLARTRADSILAQGVTTLEVKSGYGLSLQDELRLLRLISRLAQEHRLDLHPTFLGAHVVPQDFAHDREGYIRLIIDEMLPAIAHEKLAMDCDVFCEQGAFVVADAERILHAAHKLGFGLRAHVQQLGHSGGIRLITHLPIKSLSHADFLSDEDVALLAQHNVVVEALPFAALFLRSSTITPVAKLIGKKVELAIATDFNPGSAMCHDLMLAARLAVVYFGFSVELALCGITLNAAKALGRNDIGHLATGMKADVVITNATSVEELFYDWTKPTARMVIKHGAVVA